MPKNTTITTEEICKVIESFQPCSKRFVNLIRKRGWTFGQAWTRWDDHDNMAWLCDELIWGGYLTDKQFVVLLDNTYDKAEKLVLQTCGNSRRLKCRCSRKGAIFFAKEIRWQSLVPAIQKVLADLDEEETSSAS